MSFRYSELEYKCLIFDLDGTLIDSSDSILRCFEETLRSFGLRPQVELSSSLVGPPLRTVFEQLLHAEDRRTVDRAIEKFKLIYDSYFFDICNPFPAATEYFACVHQKENFLVTNKRRTPTEKILNKFSWSHVFKCVYTSDEYTDEMPDKCSVIETILKTYGLRKDVCVYIGDTDDDLRAASSAGISFFNPHTLNIARA